MNHLDLIKWLLSDDTGSSSKHMAAVACGLPGRRSHPSDAGDLGRCIRLVEAVPEIRDEFPSIAKSSPQWAIVIKHWNELELMYETERAGRRYFSAPRTYARMKELGL